MKDNGFIGVMIVPTGIGAEIGGHAGDANPVAKLIASMCDELIVHPNVVNASDINEMPENCLYVEGSMLDRFLEESINFERVYSNRILVVVNAPANGHIINAVSAARVTLGVDAKIMELKTPLVMKATKEKGIATGEVTGWKELVQQVSKVDYDALAIVTHIDYDDEVALDYLNNGGINPWGGVEAKASKLIANALDKPVAHAPAIMENDFLLGYKGVVDPRMAPEMIPIAMLHCLMKGLHKAPIVSEVDNLNALDVSFMITPANVVGRPHYACMKLGIPIISVKENKTVLNDEMPDSFIVVENYMEAIGVIQSIKEGITIQSIRRPIKETDVFKLTCLDEIYETIWDERTTPV